MAILIQHLQHCLINFLKKQDQTLAFPPLMYLYSMKQRPAVGQHLTNKLVSCPALNLWTRF